MKLKVIDTKYIPIELLVPRRKTRFRTPEHEAKELQEIFKKFDESVAKFGFLYNPIVKPLPDGRFEIIAGNTRYKYALARGWTGLVCKIVDAGDEDVSIISFIENEHREGFSWYDRAQNIAKIFMVRKFNARIRNKAYWVWNDERQEFVYYPSIGREKELCRKGAPAPQTYSEGEKHTREIVTEDGKQWEIIHYKDSDFPIYQRAEFRRQKEYITIESAIKYIEENRPAPEQYSYLVSVLKHEVLPAIGLSSREIRKYLSLLSIPPEIAMYMVELNIGYRNKAILLAGFIDKIEQYIEDEEFWKFTIGYLKIIVEILKEVNLTKEDIKGYIDRLAELKSIYDEHKEHFNFDKVLENLRTAIKMAMKDKKLSIVTVDVLVEKEKIEPEIYLEEEIEEPEEEEEIKVVKIEPKEEIIEKIEEETQKKIEKLGGKKKKKEKKYKPVIKVVAGKPKKVKIERPEKNIEEYIEKKAHKKALLEGALKDEEQYRLDTAKAIIKLKKYDVYTFGIEKMTYLLFIRLIKLMNPLYVIDLRGNAYTYKKGEFNAENLEKRLSYDAEIEDLEYHNIPDLTKDAFEMIVMLLEEAKERGRSVVIFGYQRALMKMSSDREDYAPRHYVVSRVAFTPRIDENRKIVYEEKYSWLEIW
ncbi:ParB-like nuclease domain-containing protein [uncultured archaeal virus]|jgi:hypothetical protein|uniref:ParB-like nuclease domain-containing protein n=1 Tax=uncultured archaeal virus TaxID=1960247 RepID=A0A1S5Y360_9VIRU|nr:ParB-like nuclease domain-containing protein [uncultured archaeal virus]